MKNTMCDILAYQGRVAGSLILFLVEVACQLVWLHVLFVFWYRAVFLGNRSTYFQVGFHSSGPRGGWARETGAVWRLPARWCCARCLLPQFESLLEIAVSFALASFQH